MYDQLVALRDDISSLGGGIVYVNAEEVKNLGMAGLIAVEHDAPALEDKLAVKLTDEGLKYLIDNKPIPTDNATDYQIESGFEIPPVKRKPNSKSEKYPFSAMEVDQSFHVPVSEKCPNPGKSLQTAVSAATTRYKVEDPEGGNTKNRKGEKIPLLIKTREFSLRTVGNDDPKGPGARIYRIK